MPTATADQTIIEFDVPHRRDARQHGAAASQHARRACGSCLRTDGEVISEVQPHLGYLHRCAEKIGENVMPIQFIPYTDRMDYLAGMNMNLGYSLAIEKLCGMKIPEKAQVIRVLIGELNRIASHLVGMGAYGLDLGSFSPFLYAFREREHILDLFEDVCGARLTYSYITIGGVHDDLPDGWLARCKKFIEYFKPRIAEYHAMLTNNHIFVKRTAGIGILSKEMALNYGCTGPMLRASLDRSKGDPDWDLRKTRTELRLRELSIRRAVAALSRSAGRRGDRRLLAPLLRAHARSGGKRQNRRTSDGKVSGGPRFASHRTAAHADARRMLRRDRMPARSNGLLCCRPARERGSPSARPGPLVLLQQPLRRQ